MKAEIQKALEECENFLRGKIRAIEAAAKLHRDNGNEEYCAYCAKRAIHFKDVSNKFLEAKYKIEDIMSEGKND